MDKLKVLVVDDSLVYRNIISRAVEKTDIALVDCTASSGVTALERLEQRSIDVVLLDVFMPEMDGFETLVEIKKRHSTLPVIIISSGGEDGAKSTVQALEQGAMDFVLKPLRGDTEKNMTIISRHLGILFSQIVMDKYAVNYATSKNRGPYKQGTTKGYKNSMGHGDRNRSPSLRTMDLSAGSVAAPLNGVDLVVIASSTGGPHAVEEVCRVLDAGFSKPILMVQHMPPDFTKIFAEFLSRKCKIQVKEAQEGDEIIGGRALVAPGGYHMVVKENANMISLTKYPPVHGVRPAADILFKSVAKIYKGKRVLAIILTGMGSDGTEGVRAIKESCQCYCITQSEETCVIYGMPRNVNEAGLSDETADLKDIGRRIIEISRGGC